jgi:RNA polymerase sigma-70 factor (ECF subfamily)
VRALTVSDEERELQNEGGDRKDRRATLAAKSSLNAGQLELHDVQLLRRVMEKDRLAFEALYRSFFPRLTRFLDRMTRSTTLIEEIVNDTMFVVWRKADTFDRTSKVSTWIFSIAYRTALRAFRGMDQPLEEDFGRIEADAAGEPDSILGQRQLQTCVSKAIDALPFEQRTVVNLAYYHGMGYQEIAETVECPVNTVKTRMFHARKRLKSTLSNVME